MGKLSLRPDRTSLIKLWWRELPPAAKHTPNIFGLFHQTVKLRFINQTFLIFLYFNEAHL